MCLLFFAIACRPDYPLIVAANRDEFYDRPTRSLQFWEDHPHVAAGKDLEKGGTWFGVSKSGRWAAVTNYREPEQNKEAKSRGALVSDYLLTDVSPLNYVENLTPRADEFNGFNLIVGDPLDVIYFSNRHSENRALRPGIYGLSNHLLDTPWPKVTRGKDAIAEMMHSKTLNSDSLFNLLGDTQTSRDDALPNTGMDTGFERLLSAAFIQGQVYGTRSSTILLINQNNRLKLEERSYYGAPHRGSDTYSSVAYEFELHAEHRTQT